MTYEQLEKEFNRKVIKLRKDCKHKEIWPWCEQYWAIGHSSGYKVRVCKKCREIVMEKSTCQKCGKKTIYHIKDKRRQLQHFFCEKCEKEIQKKNERN